MEFYKVIRNQTICRHACIGFCKAPLLCYTKLYYTNIKLKKPRFKFKTALGKIYSWYEVRASLKKMFRIGWLFNTPWLARRFKNIFLKFIIYNYKSWSACKKFLTTSTIFMLRYKKVILTYKQYMFRNLFDDFLLTNEIIETYKSLKWSYNENEDSSGEEDEKSNEREFLINICNDCDNICIDIANETCNDSVEILVSIRPEILYSISDGLVLRLEEWNSFDLNNYESFLHGYILNLKYFNIFCVWTKFLNLSNAIKCTNYNTYLLYRLYLKTWCEHSNNLLKKKKFNLFNSVTIEIYQFIYLWCVQIFNTYFLLKIMPINFTILFLNNLIIMYLFRSRIFLKKRLSRSKNTMLYNLPYILMLVFYLKELGVMAFFLKTFFEQLHFSQHKRMLYIINFLICHFSPSILNYYRCKGFYICFKGKLGVGGNARKRNYKVKVGDFSLNTLSKRLKYVNFNIWTITGTVGVKLILTY